MTADEIRAWRERHDLTQDQAGALVGVAGRSWRRWELGEREVPEPVDRLLRLAEAVPGALRALQAMR